MMHLTAPSDRPNTLPQFAATVQEYFPDRLWIVSRHPQGVTARCGLDLVVYCPKDSSPWQVELDGEGGEGQTLSTAVQSAQTQKKIQEAA